MIIRIKHYVEKLPDIDPKIVLKVISLQHLHHEIELQI